MTREIALKAIQELIDNVQDFADNEFVVLDGDGADTLLPDARAAIAALATPQTCATCRQWAPTSRPDHLCERFMRFTDPDDGCIKGYVAGVHPDTNAPSQAPARPGLDERPLSSVERQEVERLAALRKSEEAGRG